MSQLTYEQIAGVVQGLPLLDRQRLLDLLLSQPDLATEQRGEDALAVSIQGRLAQQDPNLRTLSGSIESFGHDITFEVGNLTFHTTVYFAKYPGLTRNFLGRQGWLRNVRVGLVDYENMLYLAKYE